MSFESLGQSMERRMEMDPLKKQVDASRVVEISLEILNEIFGMDLAINAKPLFLKNRTLTISCSTSSMAQEIRLHQIEIVEKINEKLGKTEVDSIRYLA